MKEKKEETKETEETKGVGLSKEEMDKLIRHHVYIAMGVGLIPIPIVDIAGLTVVHIDLLRKISRSYEVRFLSGKALNFLSSLAAGVVPVAVEPVLLASVVKFIPVIGETAGVVAMPILAGATTYAVGKVFVQHFASGGTLLTFDPDKVKEYYAQMFEEGKKVATAAK